MSPLCRGRIVCVELLDSQGRNPKSRPAVIVTPDEEIQPDGEVWVVAISTRLDAAIVPGRQLLDILSRLKPLDPPAPA